MLVNVGQVSHSVINTLIQYDIGNYEYGGEVPYNERVKKEKNSPKYFLNLIPIKQ
jgi:hypothetical protein